MQKIAKLCRIAYCEYIKYHRVHHGSPLRSYHPGSALGVQQLGDHLALPAPPRLHRAAARGIALRGEGARNLTAVAAVLAARQVLLQEDGLSVPRPWGFAWLLRKVRGSLKIIISTVSEQMIKDAARGAFLHPCPRRRSTLGGH